MSQPTHLPADNRFGSTEVGSTPSRRSRLRSVRLFAGIAQVRIRHAFSRVEGGTEWNVLQPCPGPRKRLWSTTSPGYSIYILVAPGRPRNRSVVGMVQKDDYSNTPSCAWYGVPRKEREPSRNGYLRSLLPRSSHRKDRVVVFQ